MVAAAIEDVRECAFTCGSIMRKRWISSGAEIREQSMKKHRFSVTATYRIVGLFREIYLQTVNIFYTHRCTRAPRTKRRHTSFHDGLSDRRVVRYIISRSVFVTKRDPRSRKTTLTYNCGLRTYNNN